ncbi:2,3-bisphosphoglycerate-dependent phosphoglycerate mutase, partial [Bacillus paranthracis]|uniref:2,3-bisphosphoglycerate-dependent phosphoglycerate mutase n=1 Tax=Bacillus paranthracis TaxID=2026186 RepID=UPI0028407721
NIWRRSSDVRPPSLTEEDARYEMNDPGNKALKKGEFPLTECLVYTEKRVLAYWHSEIVPKLKNGNKVIISSHGNTIRSLVKYLDDLSSDGVISLNIP